MGSATFGVGPARVPGFRDCAAASRRQPSATTTMKSQLKGRIDHGIARQRTTTKGSLATPRGRLVSASTNDNSSVTALSRESCWK